MAPNVLAGKRREMRHCGTEVAPLWRWFLRWRSTNSEARGAIVKAYIVTVSGVTADAALATALQDHVKSRLAPHKYPRWIEFRQDLPKTATGKIQRFKLRAEGPPR